VPLVVWNVTADCSDRPIGSSGRSSRQATVAAASGAPAYAAMTVSKSLPAVSTVTGRPVPAIRYQTVCSTGMTNVLPSNGSTNSSHAVAGLARHPAPRVAASGGSPPWP
jgi:hypothetical protein